MTLLQKYEKALEVAQSNEKLQCVMPQIQQTIEKLKSEGYNPTPVEDLWVDYFLEKNWGEIPLEQAIDRISLRIEALSNIKDDIEDLKLAIEALEKQVRLREWVEQQKQKDPQTETSRHSILNLMREQFMIGGK